MSKDKDEKYGLCVSSTAESGMSYPYVKQTVTYSTEAKAEAKVGSLKRLWASYASITKTEDGFEVSWVRHI